MQKKKVIEKSSNHRRVKRHGRHFVYMVLCRDGCLYTGYSKDVEKRVALHNTGRGAKYLRGKLPVELVYSKEFKYFKLALNAERDLKSKSRRQKDELIRQKRGD